MGAVIQSYMRRAEADVEKLLAERIRIRLCKGAYKEPDEIAFQKKSEVDANYVKLMKVLMKSGVYHGLATHDEKIINQAKAFATRKKSLATPSNSRCCTVSAATCSGAWCGKAGACASTSRLARSGIPISCAAWRNGRRMPFSSREISCASAGSAYALPAKRVLRHAYRVPNPSALRHRSRVLEGMNIT